ncbi:hypothetical protein Lbir_0383 [Legionella birminghamensis]|uniref:Uncharacterized protein n=1 Tax=Legionella birminghamensis TaxID=28083 RepID=A0A378IBV8_9GAMM|nr:hypothetical protein [Legionella birminghamensis]KTC75471.1 hypothetical protein Lbir_0383 [Legionella birminghamensis]STX32697.1 Uncharacterised protein [Legionella birminghamensis]
MSLAKETVDFIIKNKRKIHSESEIFISRFEQTEITSDLLKEILQELTVRDYEVYQQLFLNKAILPVILNKFNEEDRYTLLTQGYEDFSLVVLQELPLIHQLCVNPALLEIALNTFSPSKRSEIAQFKTEFYAPFSSLLQTACHNKKSLKKLLDNIENDDQRFNAISNLFSDLYSSFLSSKDEDDSFILGRETFQLCLDCVSPDRRKNLLTSLDEKGFSALAYTALDSELLTIALSLFSEEEQTQLPAQIPCLLEAAVLAHQAEPLTIILELIDSQQRLAALENKDNENKSCLDKLVGDTKILIKDLLRGRQDLHENLKEKLGIIFDKVPPEQRHNLFITRIGNPNPSQVFNYLVDFGWYFCIQILQKIPAVSHRTLIEDLHRTVKVVPIATQEFIDILKLYPENNRFSLIMAEGVFCIDHVCDLTSSRQAGDLLLQLIAIIPAADRLSLMIHHVIYIEDHNVVNVTWLSYVCFRNPAIMGQVFAQLDAKDMHTLIEKNRSVFIELKKRSPARYEEALSFLNATDKLHIEQEVAQAEESETSAQSAPDTAVPQTLAAENPNDENIQPSLINTQSPDLRNLESLLSVLINNIEQGLNGRKTKGEGSVKVKELSDIKNKLSDKIETTEQTLAGIEKICAKNRNWWHFFGQPHSVKELEKLQETHGFKAAPR